MQNELIKIYWYGDRSPNIGTVLRTPGIRARYYYLVVRKRKRELWCERTVHKPEGPLEAFYWDSRAPHRRRSE